MVKIAIMGMGVVGGGVADIILNNAKTLLKQAGAEIEIKFVLDRRSFEGHALEKCVTDNIDKIIEDNEVEIVIEAMGGIHPAYEFSKRALESGKSVVTSNKAVVSAHGPELLETAAKNGVSYMFEASVGGGIPIIRPLMSCLAANNITSIFGILNGTTNYILTEMKKKGTAFADALSDAQKKGYAEADPTADIGGADTCRKICILANIAYGIFIMPEDIHYEGIETIQAEHLVLADKLGYKIKLVGSAFATENGIAAFTAPAALNEDHSIASVDGVYNAVSVTGDYVGDLLFSGQGAGALPTASAMVADIIDVIRYKPKPRLWNKSSLENLLPYEEIASEYFVCVDGDVSNEDISAIFGKAKIVLGEDRKAFVAPFEKLSQHQKKIHAIEAKGVKNITSFRILDA